MKLCLVHCPDSALHVLHPHEALVEGQIVSHSVLQDKHIKKNFFIGIQSLSFFNPFLVATQCCRARDITLSLLGYLKTRICLGGV